MEAMEGEFGDFWEVLFGHNFSQPIKAFKDLIPSTQKSKYSHLSIKKLKFYTNLPPLAYFITKNKRVFFSDRHKHNTVKKTQPD